MEIMITLSDSILNNEVSEDVGKGQTNEGITQPCQFICVKLGTCVPVCMLGIIHH